MKCTIWLSFLLVTIIVCLVCWTAGAATRSPNVKITVLPNKVKTFAMGNNGDDITITVTIQTDPGYYIAIPGPGPDASAGNWINASSGGTLTRDFEMGNPLLGLPVYLTVYVSPPPTFPPGVTPPLFIPFTTPTIVATNDVIPLTQLPTYDTIQLVAVFQDAWCNAPDSPCYADPSQTLIPVGQTEVASTFPVPPESEPCGTDPTQPCGILADPSGPWWNGGAYTWPGTVEVGPNAVDGPSSPPPISNDGHYLTAGLIKGADSEFYGTAEFGGSTNGGTVFKMTSSGAVSIVHSFGDGSSVNDGARPYGALVLASDGNFYGTTYYGGSTVSSDPLGQGFGTVYKMAPTGTVTILHSFGDGTVANDGSNPMAALIEGSDGNFYGTTLNGGEAESGTIFKITPSGTVTILHSFADGSVTNDGANPMASLIQASDGNFYGTTQAGLTSGGTVFKITPSGAETTLHGFGDGSVTNDGIAPTGTLTQGSDGNFYGTTFEGGTSGFDAGPGTIFEITPAGTETILHTFGDGSVANDGMYPYSGLYKGSDGNLYGTTVGGGAAGSGTVFKITPSGVVTILHSFGDGSVSGDGINPYTALIQSPGGDFYGTTVSGGTFGYGATFQMTSSGAVTILHSFGIGLTAYPGNGEVVLSWKDSTAADSYNIYRSTSSGGETLYQPGVSGPTYADVNVANGTAYYYEVTAVNSAGESGKSNEASASASSGSIAFPTGLQMFSLPYAYPGDSLDSVFGYTGVTLAVWSPLASQYMLSPTAPADQINIGQAYWVNFPQLVTITAPGTSAPTIRNFDIPLAEGWNMIGDPFPVAVPVANLLFNNGTETFAGATSGGSPLIGGTLWSYLPSGNQYSAATILAPEGGYWIFAFAKTDVEVPHP